MRETSTLYAGAGSSHGDSLAGEVAHGVDARPLHGNGLDRLGIERCDGTDIPVGRLEHEPAVVGKAATSFWTRPSRSGGCRSGSGWPGTHFKSQLSSVNREGPCLPHRQYRRRWGSKCRLCHLSRGTGKSGPRRPPPGHNHNQSQCKDLLHGTTASSSCFLQVLILEKKPLSCKAGS